MSVFTFLPEQDENAITHNVTGSLNAISCNSVLSKNDTVNGCVVSHSKPPTALYWAKLTLPIVPWLKHSFSQLHTILRANARSIGHGALTTGLIPQWISTVPELFNHWARELRQCCQVKNINYTHPSLPQHRTIQKSQPKPTLKD